MGDQDEIRSNKKTSAKNNRYPPQEEFLYIRALLNDINSRGKLSNQLIEELLPLLIKSLCNNHAPSSKNIQAANIHPDAVEEAFIKTLYDIRINKKLTQKELSKKSNTHIGRIETGNANVRLLTIYKICQALDISIAEFFEELEHRLPFIQ